MFHLHVIIALCTLGLLWGCSGLSPEAQCFAGATTDYRAAWRAAQSAEANLARGYALHRQEVPTLRAATCTRRGGPPRTCLINDRHLRETPVAIDRAGETARLSAANARMDALRPAAVARAAPCGYDPSLARDALSGQTPSGLAAARHPP